MSRLTTRANVIIGDFTDEELGLQNQYEVLREMLQSLEEVKQQFKFEKDRAPIAYLIHDFEGHILESSLRAREMLGVQDDEFSSLQFVFSDSLLSFFNTNAQNACRLKKETSIEFVLPNVADKARYIRAYTHELEGGHFHTILVDITIQKESEIIHKRVQAKTQHAQKMEAIALLTSGIAHDFNNILQVLCLQTELALDSRESDDQESLDEALHSIQDASRRGMDLTKSLLSFSRKAPLRKERCDLQPILENSVRFLSHSLGEHWTIRFDCQKMGNGILADPNQIEQVIVNLCLNARDAMPEGGEITIELNSMSVSEQKLSHLDLPAGYYNVISIHDNGPGIPSDLVEKIFEPFFTTKNPGKGTGLGLSMAKSVISQHNGAMELAQTSSKGATFRIYLPGFVLPPQSELELKGVIQQKELHLADVLVCDDEPAICRAIATRFEKHGVNIKVANCGAEALELIEKTPRFDALVTDVVMADFNGDVVALKFFEKYPGKQILFMSGNSESVLNKETFESLGADYIAKPFSLEQISTKIDTMMQHHIAPSLPR